MCKVYQKRHNGKKGTFFLKISQNSMENTRARAITPLKVSSRTGVFM